MSDVLDHHDLVRFARAMIATGWDAERVVDFFATPGLWQREIDVWTALDRPSPGDPTWDQFEDLALSEYALRRFLWERL